MIEQTTPLSKLRVFYLYFFFTKFTVYFPFLAVLFRDVAHLSPSQILTVFSAFALSGFLLEIPTGAFSDRFGEKKSVVLGTTVCFMSIWLLISGKYLPILCGEVLLAAGGAFVSGSIDALAYRFFKGNESVFAQKNLDYKRFAANYTSIMWFSIALSAAAGQLVAYVDIILTFHITAFSYMCAIIAAFMLPDPPMVRHAAFSGILRKSLFVVLTARQVRNWCLLSVFFSSILVTGYHILQPLLNEMGVAGPRNGMLYCVLTVFAFLGARIQPRTLSIVRSRRNAIVTLSIGLNIVFFLLAIVNNYVLLVGVCCLFRVFWGWASPLFVQSLNEAIDDNTVRSSILSINAMFCGLGTSVMLYVFAIASFDMKHSYVVLALLMLTIPALLLVSSFKKRSGREHAVA